MKRILQFLVITAILIGLFSFVTDGTASAHNTITNASYHTASVTKGSCGKSKDFWEVSYVQNGLFGVPFPPDCFANAGTWSEPLHDVLRICSGNNRGKATIAQYDANQKPVVLNDTFNRHQCRNYNDGTIEEFTIF